MAKFPIEYAKALPSGRAAAVRADTGAAELGEAYSRMGAAVAGLGGNIFGMAMAIQNQQDVADYSELKRKFDEAGFAIYNSATGDIDVDEKSWTDFETKSSTDFQHKRKNVNNMLTRHINEVMPDWKQSFYKHSLGLARKDVHAKFVLESENRLSEPTLTNYYVLLDQRKKLKDITQSEYDILLERAPNDSVLQKMRKSIGQGNPQAAIEQAKQMKDATADQMDYRDKYLRRAERDLKQNSEQAITSVVIKKDNLKDVSLGEKTSAVIELKQELINGGVAGDDLNRWFGILDKWSEGGKDPTEEYNPQTYAGLSAVCDLNPRSISEAQIYSFVGLGREKGITTEQAKSLIQLRKRNIDEVGSMQNEIHRRYQTILKGMYNAELFGSGADAPLKYAETANKLTVWSNVNKEATPEQTEKFFTQLIAENEKESWLKMIFSRRWLGGVGTMQLYAEKRLKKLKSINVQAKSSTLENTSDDELLRTIMSK